MAILTVIPLVFSMVPTGALRALTQIYYILGLYITLQLKEILFEMILQIPTEILSGHCKYSMELFCNG